MEFRVIIVLSIVVFVCCMQVCCSWHFVLKKQQNLSEFLRLRFKAHFLHSEAVKSEDGRCGVLNTLTFQGIFLAF